MNETLHDKFTQALSEKTAAVKRHESELKQLTRLHKTSKKFDILWDEKVTSKNAQKSIQLGNILSAFSKRLSNVQAYEVLSDVRMSTYQLWKFSQHNTISSNSGPTAKFRGYLNHLKCKNLLSFDTSNRKWSLTPNSLKRMGGK